MFVSPFPPFDKKRYIKLFYFFLTNILEGLILFLSNTMLFKF